MTNYLTNGSEQISREFFNKLVFRLNLSSKKFCKKYPSKVSKRKTAILYYKFIDKNKFKHPNNQNIKCILDTLNSLGFDVILVDRRCKVIPKEYRLMKISLFIGIDGSGGAKYFFDHLNALNAERNYLILTVQPPNLLKKRLDRREKLRKKLLKINFDYTRKISFKEVEKFNSEIHKVDAILTAETKDKEYQDALSSFNVKVEKLNWSTFSQIKPIKRIKECSNNVVLMCGNDPLRKGIDFSVEIFKNLPYTLHIFSPDQKLVETILAKNNYPRNILFYGFIDILSKDFENIIKNSKFILNLSASEGGISTSMLHCMKTGLVPIMDKDSGIVSYQGGLIIDLFNNGISKSTKEIDNYIKNITWNDYLIQSNNATEFVLKNHTIQSYQRDLVKVFSN